MGLIEGRERFFEPLAPASVEIDDGTHTGCIHLFHVVPDALGSQDHLATTQVVMNVDDRKGRFRNFSHLGHEHRPRLPIAELQLLDIPGVLGRSGG